MEFYTYVWRDSDGVPFYVGKGKGNRAHNAARRSKEFKDIHVQGGCVVEIVDYFIHESQAHAHEIELIERYGRRENGGSLVNKTDGGEGTSGRTLSEDAKRRISVAMSGRTISEVTRLRVGAASRGRVKSEATKAKHRAAILGTKMSPEASRKISQSKIGKPRPPHVGEAVRKARLGVPLAPDVVSKRSASVKMSGPRISSASGYKCVSARRDKWSAYIDLSSGRRFLGVFAAPKDAARAYDKAAYSAWGGDCYLNFPSEPIKDEA